MALPTTLLLRRDLALEQLKDAVMLAKKSDATNLVESLELVGTKNDEALVVAREVDAWKKAQEEVLEEEKASSD